MKTLQRKALLLIFLAVLTTLAGLTPAPAAASYQDCIAWCDYMYTLCVQGCPAPGQKGRLPCLQDCAAMYQSCVAAC